MLDAYDVYQRLMNYWDETMQDDAYLLAQEGWTGVVDGEPSTDLIPPPLIIRRYFAAEAAAIEQYRAERDAIALQMEELNEEHAGEDSLLAEARNDKGRLTRASVRARRDDLKGDPDAAEERQLLTDYLALIEGEAAASKKLREAQKDLENKVAAQYARLTEPEIKTLVVDDKWLAALADEVQTELDHVSQALTGRIRQLAERYAAPLPRLADEAAALSSRVEQHLMKMGALWD